MGCASHTSVCSGTLAETTSIKGTSNLSLLKVRSNVLATFTICRTSARVGKALG